MAEYRYDTNGHLLVFKDLSARIPELDPTRLAGWCHVHEDQALACAVEPATLA